MKNKTEKEYESAKMFEVTANIPMHNTRKQIGKWIKKQLNKLIK